MISILTFLLFASVAMASPCRGIDQALSPEAKASLAPTIAKQMQTSNVEVLRSFRGGDWSILYVDPHDSDEAFLFYSGNPQISHFVTLWAGAATTHEQATIRKWVRINAPGIPAPLAACFAWYVTQGRTE